MFDHDKVETWMTKILRKELILTNCKDSVQCDSTPENNKSCSHAKPTVKYSLLLPVIS